MNSHFFLLAVHDNRINWSLVCWNLVCCCVYFCFHHYLSIITFTAAAKSIPLVFWWNCLQIVIYFWTWFRLAAHRSANVASYSIQLAYYLLIRMYSTMPKVFIVLIAIITIGGVFLVFVLQKSSTCFAFILLGLDYVFFYCKLHKRK